MKETSVSFIFHNVFQKLSSSGVVKKSDFLGTGLHIDLVYEQFDRKTARYDRNWHVYLSKLTPSLCPLLCYIIVDC